MKHSFIPLCAAFAASILATPPILADEAVDLPYQITFDANNYTTWAVIDANNDAVGYNTNYTWNWNTNAKFNVGIYSGISGDNADDYAISPGFNLKEGVQYELTYYLYGQSSSSGVNANGTFEIVNSRTEVDENPVIILTFPEAGKKHPSNEREEAITVKFTSTVSGLYYIACHVTAPKGSGGLRFREFGLKELASAKAPGMVTGLAVTPGTNGAETAAVTFKAPEIDAEGNPATGTCHVKLYREDEQEPFFTSRELEPGEEDVCNDTEAFAGETWYIARAENEAGTGAESRIDTYIGIDTPEAVTDLAASVVDGNIVLTWTAPTTSVHGGYIDYQTLTYTVTRVIDEEMTPLPGNITGTTFTDSELSDATQVNVSYQVYGRTSAGAGKSAQTSPLNYGTAYELPFTESFANKSYTTSPWRQETIKTYNNTNPKWEPIESATVTVYSDDEDDYEGISHTIASQDTDKGMIKFTSSGFMSNGCIGRLISPAIDLSNAKNPVLKFYMFRETYYTTDPATNGGYHDDYVAVELSTDNGEFVPVKDAEFHRYGTENNWVLCEVPLYLAVGQSRVQISLTGHASGTPVYIDNITLEDNTAFDMQAVSLSGPSRLRVGDEGKFSFSYKNAGGSEASDYTLKLYLDGREVLSEAGNAIVPGKVATHIFTYTPELGLEGTTANMTAAIVYAADLDNTNDTSEAIETLITAPLLPTVTGLTGSSNDGQAILTWKKASYIDAEALIEEDGFERYEPFVINTFGDFTSYDLDQRITAGIGAAAGVIYENSGEKMAWQVFAPAQTNIDPEELHIWAVHSGNNMLVSPQALNPSSTTGTATSNDWLVFPRLSGNAQQITFFARSVNSNYAETMQGFYATTANPTDADDFLPCPDGGNINYTVSPEWTEYHYNVPTGAKYFALRHTSADGYAFMVDDVTYERSIPDAEELGITGYNVYCDDEKVNAEPIPAGTMTFTHRPTATGTYTYAVSAVYPTGESAKSAPVTIMIEGDGISSTTGEMTAVSVNGLEVTVTGAENELVSLTSVSGVVLYSEISTGNVRFTANTPGIYVLTIGNTASKIVLR